MVGYNAKGEGFKSKGNSGVMGGKAQVRFAKAQEKTQKVKVKITGAKKEVAKTRRVVNNAKSGTMGMAGKSTATPKKSPKLVVGGVRKKMSKEVMKLL